MGTTTLSIMTFSITTLCIMGLFATLSIRTLRKNDTQLRIIEFFFIVMLNVIMLSVVMMSVVMLTVVTLSVVESS
jgi:hypothetical protein